MGLFYKSFSSSSFSDGLIGVGSSFVLVSDEGFSPPRIWFSMAVDFL